MKLIKGLALASAVGLAAGESNTDISVQHLSKLAMHSLPDTSGLKLGCTSLASSFLQFTTVNHLCPFISSAPFGPLPSRLSGSFCSSYIAFTQTHHIVNDWSSGLKVKDSLLEEFHTHRFQ